MLTKELAFLQQDDVVKIAQQLIGYELIHQFPNGKILSGIICETEAYKAPEDKASHAYKNRRTKRTEIMFADAGHIYIYLCYGVHHLLNIVTHQIDSPHAVLIRGIVPLKGEEIQVRNRNAHKWKKGLMFGPGKVTQALEINTSLNGQFLNQSHIHLKHHIDSENLKIKASKRIGIDYADEWKDRMWRFYADENEIKEILVTVDKTTK